jgi:hypothetical protein
MTEDKGTSFRDLFGFYYSTYKPLYSRVSAKNSLSQETLFEVNAAFDHVARHYSPNAGHDDTEPKCASKAMSHIKRACLDMYKLEYFDTKEIHDALCKLPIHLIDNGEYENKLRRLFSETKEMATKARELEGVSSDGRIAAFDIWQKVFVNCARISSTEFYTNPNVAWASRKRKAMDWAAIVGIALGVLGLLVALGVVPPIR